MERKEELSTSENVEDLENRKEAEEERNLNEVRRRLGLPIEVKDFPFKEKYHER